MTPMRRWRRVCGLGLCALAWAAAPARAGFFNAEAGVRPAGMGEAFVAVADDVNTGLHNPAGYTRLQNLEIAGMYADLYEHFDPKIYTGQTDHLGYSLVTVSLPDLGALGHVGLTWNQFYSLLYQENTYLLSYAHSVWSEQRLDLGVNLKLLQWQLASNVFTADAQDFPQLQKSGVTVDVGALSVPWPGVTLGLGVENLLPADLGLNENETVPMVERFGVSWRLPWQAGGRDTLLLASEANLRAGMLDVRCGLEVTLWQRVLALRAGYNRDNLSAGFGLNYSMPNAALVLQLDYAWVYPLQISGTLGSHRIGLTLCWDEHPIVTERVTEKQVVVYQENPEDAKLRAKIKELEEQKKALEEQLRLFKRDIEVGTLHPILFKTGKSTLLPSDFDTLDYLGKILEQYPELVVRIDGHTDDVGGDTLNLTLSQNRAEAVKSYLVAQYAKIRPALLIPVGYGKTRPISMEAGEAGRSKNRRVEFIVINPYAAQ
jgi:outer membrane protein OmpA-like peptidoglycan-associated protein